MLATKNASAITAPAAAAQRNDPRGDHHDGGDVSSPKSTEFTAMMKTMLLPAHVRPPAVRLEEVVGVLGARAIVVRRAHEPALDAGNEARVVRAQPVHR